MLKTKSNAIIIRNLNNSFDNMWDKKNTIRINHNTKIITEYYSVLHIKFKSVTNVFSHEYQF